MNPLVRYLSVVLTVILLVFVVCGIGALIWRSIKRAEDPARMLFKWVLTLILGGALGGLVLGWGPDFASAFIVPLLCVGFAIIMSLLWTPHLGASLIKPLTSAFDGGDESVDPEPLYSTALSRIKKGHYIEASYAIKEQLAKFPNDFQGQSMLAELQATHLNDLPGAQVTIDRLCAQPGHSPKNIAFVLNQLADWYLKYATDVESARSVLERLIELMPNSKEANDAYQRLAHMTSTDNLLEQFERSTIKLRPGIKNVGLMKDVSPFKQPEIDPEVEVGNCVRQLEAHPYDFEARERLAWLYAEHHGRVDMAIEQLEQLIAFPNVSPQNVARWLNQATDIQVRFGNNQPAAAECLERILTLYPDTALAHSAQERLNHLGLELRSAQGTPIVKLGAYEQNIGLKRGKSTGPTPS